LSPDSQFCAALTIIPFPTPPAPNGGYARFPSILAATLREQQPPYLVCFCGTQAA